MRSVRLGASRGDFVRLFEGESVAGVGEGELLDRFATGRDEAAFEALVTRLGPMVLGVCRRMLADPHDVDDAFQATFLVLVKKAGSIRDRDLLAPWLYGVASKVARRARAESARRKARERVATVPEAVEDGRGVESGWLELRALIDEEIGRLPEDHRRAVVLCDVEGLSREEAASRLGWTLNMVRGRLERARGRLRGRLARRGVAPSGGWMALLVAPPTPSPFLVAGTVRAALAFASGRVVAGLVPASAVALAQGVSRMMMLSKAKVGLAALLSAGFVVGGSGMLAAQGPGDKPATKPAVVAPQAASPFVVKLEGSLEPIDLPALKKSRVEMARKRWETQKTSYDEGRLTVDRLLNASQTLMEAEIDSLETPELALTPIQAHLERVKGVEARELAELEVGRATRSDVEEIQSYRLDVEFRRAKTAAELARKGLESMKPAAGSSPAAVARTSLDQERVAIARRLYDQARRLQLGGEGTLVDVLEAEVTLAKAEEGAARSRADRIAAVRTQVDRLQRIVAANEKLAKLSQASPRDVDRARLRLLDAMVYFADGFGTPDGASETVVPTPNGPLPAPAPAPKPPAAARKDVPRISLARAIEEFNLRALNDEVGRQERALTEDEVVAAIRLYEPKGPEVPGDLLALLREIVEAGQFPSIAKLDFKRSMDPGGDFLFDGWWVQVEMLDGDGVIGGEGRTVVFPIRSTAFRTVRLEEARDRAYAAALKFSQGADNQSRGMAMKFHHLTQTLEERIEKRDAKGAGKAAPAALRR